MFTDPVHRLIRAFHHLKFILPNARILPHGVLAAPSVCFPEDVESNEIQ